MSQGAPYLHIVRIDIDDELAPAFHRWYDEVHVPALLACPGWLSARRYEALDGGPRYAAVYEIAGLWVYDTPEFARAKGFGEFEDRVRNFERLQLRPLGGPSPGQD